MLVVVETYFYHLVCYQLSCVLLLRLETLHTMELTLGLAISCIQYAPFPLLHILFSWNVFRLH